MTEISKNHVIDESLHEIKQDIIVDYDGEIEMIEKYQLVIKSEKLMLDSEILLNMSNILTLLLKDMMQKMLFSMVLFIKSLLPILT